jgi:hypothetical protein
MSLRSFANRSIAAGLGIAMIALSLTPASALTLPGPQLGQAMASAQVDKVYWRRWGWGPVGILGGLAAGAVVGSAIAGPGYYGYGPGYYRPYYGYGPAGYYGDCWRRSWDYYGRPYWARVC